MYRDIRLASVLLVHPSCSFLEYGRCFSLKSPKEEVLGLSHIQFVSVRSHKVGNDDGELSFVDSQL